MKSKVLKVSALANERIIGELRTKPMGLFTLLFFIGLCFLLFDRVYQAIGMLMMAFSVFAIFIAPDNTLMQFTEEFIVFFNLIDRDECKLIYWDEVLNWSYLKRNRFDFLVIELVDGTTEKMECYNRIRVENYMRVYAGGKQKKYLKGKRSV